MQMISTVTSKGQVVIPVPIRNKLHIKAFDRVIFSLSAGKITAQKAPGTSSMYGFIKTKKKLSDKKLEQEIDKAMEEGMIHNL